MRKTIKNNRVTKDVLASFIAEDTKYKKAMVLDVIDTMLKQIRLQLIQGNEIIFHQFFKVKTTTRKSTRAFNPAKGEIFDVPEHRRVKFTTLTDLKRAVKTIPVEEKE